MKIKPSHIEAYKLMGGDIDHLARSGNYNEKKIEFETAMSIINELISDLNIINNGIASESFTKKTMDKLNSVCLDSSVSEQIIELANSSKY